MTQKARLHIPVGLHHAMSSRATIPGLSGSICGALSVGRGSSIPWVPFRAAPTGKDEAEPLHHAAWQKNG